MKISLILLEDCLGICRSLIDATAGNLKINKSVIYRIYHLDKVRIKERNNDLLILFR